jgi:CelD/BcsL family acetyltransferase involved in cellulose biosynthesis
MVNALIENRGEWDMMYLRHVPENSPTLEFLTESGFCRLCHRRIIQRKRTVSLTIQGSWEDLKESMSGKARWKIRNRSRKLEKTGELRTFHCSTEPEFLDYMQKFFELHCKRWNSSDTPSNFNDVRFRNFYLDVIPRLLPKKQVDLYVMEAGDKTLAMMFSFLQEKNCLTQLTIYDTDFEKLSPSIIAQDRFVEESYENRIEVLDFGDYYPFKEMWARESSYKVSMEFYPRKTLRSVLLYFFTAIGEPLRALLRKIKPLRKMVILRRQQSGSASRAEEV